MKNLSETVRPKEFAFLHFIVYLYIALNSKSVGLHLKISSFWFSDICFADLLTFDWLEFTKSIAGSEDGVPVQSQLLITASKKFKMAVKRHSDVCQ